MIETTSSGIRYQLRDIYSLRSTRISNKDKLVGNSLFIDVIHPTIITNPSMMSIYRNTL
jgi:hypothetical protein